MHKIKSMTMKALFAQAWIDRLTESGKKKVELINEMCVCVCVLFVCECVRVRVC